ncbi:MAG: MFS transporter [Candidatus Binatia bacterium]
MSSSTLTHDLTGYRTGRLTGSSTQTLNHETETLRSRAVLSTLLLNAVTPLLLIMTALTEPDMGRSLGIPASKDVWLAEALMAAQIILTPLCGFLITRLGVVPLLRLCVLGIIVSGLISVGVGFLDALRSLPLLAGLIFVQGMCMAPLTPATQVLIIASHGKDERARGMAVWTAARYVGFLSGSLLAGWIAQSLSWPLIFLIAPLLALTSLIWLRGRVDHVQAANLSVDWRGFFLLVLTMIALQVLLNTDSASTWLAFAISTAVAMVTVAGMIFLFRHLSRASNPIVSLDPLRNRWFATAVGLSFAVNIFTTGQFEILLLGSTLHVPPEILGIRSALGGLAQIAGVLIVGHWLRRERLFLFVSCSTVMMLIGLYGYTWYGPQMSYTLAIWTRMASGLGMGLCAASLSVAAFDSLPERLNGQAASLLALSTTLGTALGISGLDIIFKSEEHLRLIGEAGAYHSVFWTQFCGAAMLLPFLWIFRSRPTAAQKVTAQEY